MIDTGSLLRWRHPRAPALTSGGLRGGSQADSIPALRLGILDPLFQEALHLPPDVPRRFSGAMAPPSRSRADQRRPARGNPVYSGRGQHIEYMIYIEYVTDTGSLVRWRHPRAPVQTSGGPRGGSQAENRLLY